MKPTSIYSPEPAKGWLPWGALAPFLCILIVALPMVGVSRVEQHFQLVDAKGEPVGFAGLCSFLLAEFSAIGLVLLAWVRLVERRSLATIGLVEGRRVRTLLRGLAIGIASSFAVVAAIWLAGGYSASSFAKAWASPGALLKIGFLLVGFVVQSSVEEILFRGWLFSAVARKLNVGFGVALSSLVFTLLHFDPGQHWSLLLTTLFFSLFACAWALKTGNVWGVMGWHAGWNWLLGVGFEVPVTGINVRLPALLVKLTPIGPDSLTGGTQGPEGSFFCSFFLAGASAILLWSLRRSRETSTPAVPPPEPA
ncbi:MAG TPA: type II CAAX endopeptidase family protein [Thermoanaerobaculia bacterium]|nr:type II CAAX endopeptidase family protein [Thermoanaerobaculia bacterium]